MTHYYEERLDGRKANPTRGKNKERDFEGVDGPGMFRDIEWKRKEKQNWKAQRRAKEKLHERTEENLYYEDYE